MSCVHLYRVTRDPRHLALAKHYLDIRGRADSPGRSRHTQSWRPVTEQREAAGHAVNGVTLMLSMLDVAVYGGDRRYFDAAHARSEEHTSELQSLMRISYAVFCL